MEEDARLSLPFLIIPDEPNFIFSMKTFLTDFNKVSTENAHNLSRFPPIVFA